MNHFFSRLFSKPSIPDAPRLQKERRGKYRRAIRQTAGMTQDRQAQKLAERHGLQVLDLTWEDTARHNNSCVGPNISDMTIQVQHKGQATCMPVIRHPNFSDKTADLTLNDIRLRVGNEHGGKLKNIKLGTYLKNLRKHLSEPDSWGGKETSLLAPREREVLVSAQACFLPVPKHGEATFNPVLFNYQSSAGSPAVLAIVAGREGTSATIIDNQRDGFGHGAAWGQRLFFNDNGERASFTGTRVSEFVAQGGDAPTGSIVSRRLRKRA